MVASALQTASCRFTALAYRFIYGVVIHRCKVLRVRTTVDRVLSCRDLTIGRLTASLFLWIFTLGLALLVRNRRSIDMASTVPPCGRGSVQPLWDSTKGKYVEVECP